MIFYENFLFFIIVSLSFNFFCIRNRKMMKKSRFQNTGSQESIIQLDLDDDDESDASPPDQRRRYSVSPMPQIRSSESQVGRSSP